ncbi:MAG TPA: maleylpyruvate isomerase family mycothiol-dependent enzyme [Ilumatobacteraceae bacterium]
MNVDPNSSVSASLNGYLATLTTEAKALASAADEAGLDAAVPTCPGWTVNNLVLHLGEVHRWATAAIANRATKLGEVPLDFLGPIPERDATIEWFRSGAVMLRDTLAAADPSIEYAAFLANPITPRVRFWARRQTMETCVHRVDAESAVSRCTPFAPAIAPDVAIDGIDEFLTGFLPRARTPLRADMPHTLEIAPDYSDHRWTVTISDELPITVRGIAETTGERHCILSGSASDIYLALWNRTSLDGLTIDGDRTPIDLLRDSVHIRWG